jgi:drug/metabolite transporter (DMT)-like permease
MAVVAGFFNAFWTAISKKLLEQLSAREFTMVFRIQTCLLLLPFALLQWSWITSWQWWAFTVAAGVFEGGRIWLLISGVKKDYYSTYAFFNLTPFFTVLIAPLFLPEPQSSTLVAAGILIALGAFVFHKLGRWSWPGLIGALFSTTAAILSKKALADAPPLFFTFWAFLVAAFVLIPLENLEPQRLKGKRKINWKEWKQIFPVAFLSFLASLLFYTALKYAPVSKINPLVRANLLFGFLFSYYLLKEKKGWKSKALGGGLILGGLILVAIG